MKNHFPLGWNEERVQSVLSHYESQTEIEAIAEDQAAHEDGKHTFMEIPNELVSVVRQLLAKQSAGGELTPLFK
jgi:hypothetical protein